MSLLQLTESESQNLDLQERVQVLEERLEYLSSCHQIPEEGENYEETIKAKDQYIAKMEKEHKAIQDETAKLVCGFMIHYAMTMKRQSGILSFCTKMLQFLANHFRVKGQGQIVLSACETS